MPAPDAATAHLKVKADEARHPLAAGRYVAIEPLGLTMDELGTIADHAIEMIRRDDLDPDTPAGVRALLLICLYDRLYGLLGGASEVLENI
jgi:hypothetical protein